MPGILCHVMSRGNNKQPIFIDDDDYRDYLRRLDATTARFGISCLAFCLMVNHVHLLLRPRDISVSRMMQQLNSGYCQGFNRRHDRVGHVLQGRFLSRFVDNDPYLWRVIRYIVRNPIKAGLVETPADWRWSSYRATAGLASVPSFLDVRSVWTMFGGADVRLAQRLFRKFSVSPVDDTVSLIDQTEMSPNLRSALSEKLAAHVANADFVHRQRFADRPPIDEVLLLRPDETRSSAAARAFYEHAYTLRSIGTHFGHPPATVWSWIRQAARPAASLEAQKRPVRQSRSHRRGHRRTTSQASSNRIATREGRR